MALYSDPYSIIETGCIVSAVPYDGDCPEDDSYSIMYILLLGHGAERTLADYPDKQTRDRAFSNLRMVMGVHELDAEEEGL